MCVCVCDDVITLHECVKPRARVVSAASTPQEEEPLPTNPTSTALGVPPQPAVNQTETVGIPPDTVSSM